MGVLSLGELLQFREVTRLLKKGSFWWWDIVKLLDKFKAMAKVEIGDGASCLLWDDLWSSAPLSQKFPQLHSFARNRQIGFATGRSETSLHTLFHLPLSPQAHDQLNQMQELLDQSMQREELDRWIYISGSNQFSVKRAYRQLSGHQAVHPAFKWLWASSCQNKHKVFF